MTSPQQPHTTLFAPTMSLLDAESRLDQLEQLVNQLVKEKTDIQAQLEEEREGRKKMESLLKATRQMLMDGNVIPFVEDDNGSRFPGQWINIRIFVSSTFIDTQGERDVIIKQVIPRLNHDLQPFFIRVTPVDFRWGLVGHSADEIHKICLNEIDRCTGAVDFNPLPAFPWFLCIRTRRVGWVVSDVHPPETFDHPDRFEWLSETKSMSLSITELELMHAVVGRKEPNNGLSRAFIYFRDDSAYLPKVTEHRWIFDCDHRETREGLTPEDVPQYNITRAASKIIEDYQAIDSRIHSIASRSASIAKVFTYKPTSATTRVTGRQRSGKLCGVGHVQVPHSLADRIFVDLFEAITTQYPKPTRRMDLMSLEAVFHNNALKSVKDCFGRDQLVAEIYSSVLNPDVKRPILVAGEPGSGKTTVMGAFIKKLTADPSLFVHYHIVAASAQSFSLKNMLERICLALKKQFQLKLELPTSMDALSNTWIHFVLMAARKKNIVIVLDAVNQLSADHDALLLNWLPHEIPDSNVKIVISSIAGDDIHTRLQERVHAPPHTHIVEPMQLNDRRQMVSELLKRFHKSLSDEQMEILLLKHHSGSPLYLYLACHRLMQFGVFEELTEQINSIPGTKLELLKDILHSIIVTHGRKIVETCLLYVYFSQGGMFEHELLHLSEEDAAQDSSNDEFAANFSIVYQDLMSLMPTNPSGLLNFFHNDMRSLIFEEFLGGSVELNKQKQLEVETERELQMATKYHTSLATFYMNDVLKNENYDLRSLRVLAHHLVKANMISELKSVLLNPHVFRAMFGSGLRPDMLRLWRYVVDELAKNPDEPHINLAEAYQTIMAKEQFDDSNDEAMTYRMLGEFFMLDRETTGLDLDATASIPFFRQALTANPKDTGALIGRALIYMSQEKYDDAETDLLRALETVRAVFGPKDISTARCQKFLAELYLRKGDQSSSQQIIAKARRTVESSCGKLSVEYTEYLVAEATLLTKMDPTPERIKNAEFNLLDAIAKRKLLLGPTHPLVAEAALALADLSCSHLDDGLLQGSPTARLREAIETDVSVEGALDHIRVLIYWLEGIYKIDFKDRSDPLEDTVSEFLALLATLKPSIKPEMQDKARKDEISLSTHTASFLRQVLAHELVIAEMAESASSLIQQIQAHVDALFAGITYHVTVRQWASTIQAHEPNLRGDYTKGFDGNPHWQYFSFTAFDKPHPERKLVDISGVKFYAWRDQLPGTSEVVVGVISSDAWIVRGSKIEGVDRSVPAWGWRFVESFFAHFVDGE